MVQAPAGGGADLFTQQMMSQKGAGGGKDNTNEGLGSEDVGNLTRRLYAGLMFSHGGVQQGFDTEGVASKPIASFVDKLNSNGGFLAKLLHSIFIKNLTTITDFTAGLSEPKWTEVPVQSLGSLSPQTFASAAPSVGQGMDV